MWITTLFVHYIPNIPPPTYIRQNSPIWIGLSLLRCEIIYKRIQRAMNIHNNNYIDNKYFFMFFIIQLDNFSNYNPLCSFLISYSFIAIEKNPICPWLEIVLEFLESRPLLHPCTLSKTAALSVVTSLYLIKNDCAFRCYIPVPYQKRLRFPLLHPCTLTITAALSVVTSLYLIKNGYAFRCYIPVP